jgi:hypothetical protein
MPTSTQYEIVKQQCRAFEQAGYPASFRMQPLQNGAAPAIKIEGYFKQWHFCDPDWNVVSRQLAELYKNVTKNRAH